MTDTKEEVKFFKLVNGENIVASSYENFEDFKSKKYIQVSDPIEIRGIKQHNGVYIVETYTMQPWIKMAKTDKINIPTESIMVVVDLHDDDIMQYKEYIKDAIIPEDIEGDIEDEQNMLESEDENYGESRKIPSKIVH